MPEALPVGAAGGLLRVVSPDRLARSDREAAVDVEDTSPSVEQTMLAGHIRNLFDTFRNHRTSCGLDKRLIDARRRLRGEYDPAKLQAIRQFSGSEVYSRIVGLKCRSVSALLRDVYLGPERPWSLRSTPDPSLPVPVGREIYNLVAAEAASLAAAGQPPTEEQLFERAHSLMQAARKATLKKAREEADRSTVAVDDLLVEGGFYEALDMCLQDLPAYPYFVLKGPAVRNVTEVRWVDGALQTRETPKMFWDRVSPFMVYWTPGASSLAKAEVIEHLKLSRTEIESLLGIPGYYDSEIRKLLAEFGESGYHEQLESNEHEIAESENRESPAYNRSNLFDCLEYHGVVSGRKIQDYEIDTSSLGEDYEIEPDKGYSIVAWVVGPYVLKCMLNPDPRRRHPYYVSSFECIPGSVAGNGLSDILEDVEDVANASLRSLVNNMGMASGPQVVIREDLLSANTNPETMYPWKRWRIEVDPLYMNQANSGLRPVEFFQPVSNAQELLGVYEKCSVIADEISAIPRYITGNERVGGAGRTASGLAMLMSNASKVLQSVARNVDRDVLKPMLSHLYDMIMLTDETGMLRGDEDIEVLGVTVAIQKETDRMRRLEFLQLTANPIDMQIIGPEGRANVLREISDDLGMKGARIVPSEQELRDALAAPVEASAEQAPKPGAGGADRQGEGTDNMFRVQGTGTGSGPS